MKLYLETWQVFYHNIQLLIQIGTEIHGQYNVSTNMKCNICTMNNFSNFSNNEHPLLSDISIQLKIIILLYKY